MILAPQAQFPSPLLQWSGGRNLVKKNYNYLYKWMDLAEPSLAMFTSTGSLRPNPKEPRSALVSSFFVRTFMLLSYGSKTFRMFITSCLFRWSRCIVAATISSPGTSGVKKSKPADFLLMLKSFTYRHIP